MDTDTLAALGQSTELDPPGPPQYESIDEHLHTHDDPPCQGCGWKVTIIPEGYTRDKDTGRIRPKKARGRPRQGTPPPSPQTPIERTGDESPDSKARGKVAKGVPRWQKGVIANGMTKLYTRAGKIIKAMDRDIGIAVIESAEDCGEAWDELARTNPRVRAFLLKLITGGAWGAVVMAHLPILMAVIMKDGIRKHIPFMKLLEAATSEDENGKPDLGDLLGGMSSEDMRNMVQLGMQMMEQTAGKVNNA